MATIVSYDSCNACGETNARSLQVCKKCSAALPWAKPAKAGAVATPPRRAPGTDRNADLNDVALQLKRTRDTNASRREVDWEVYVVGLISFLIPIIGYFLYRSYSEQGSSKADVVGIAAALGLVFHILRFVAVAAMH